VLLASPEGLNKSFLTASLSLSDGPAQFGQTSEKKTEDSASKVLECRAHCQEVPVTVSGLSSST